MNDKKKFTFNISLKILTIEFVNKIYIIQPTFKMTSSAKMDVNT